MTGLGNPDLVQASYLTCQKAEARLVSVLLFVSYSACKGDRPVFVLSHLTCIT